MKTLRMTVAVFALILASAVPGFAQASVHVTGNTTFTVTWEGQAPSQGGTLLATAKFEVTNWTGTSFKMTVTNVKNTMPTSPNINARLTAFGFGLTPAGKFSAPVSGSIYSWDSTNFPAFQKVDVCLTSGSNCAGGGNGGLNQGQSSAETYSVTINGDFANGVTITPIPAKFQTSLGSLETDGVVVDPPPSGVSDLTITKTHTPAVANPGGTVTYTVTVSNVGSGPSSGDVTVTETPPPGLTITDISGPGWICNPPTGTCTRDHPLAPDAIYPPITVTMTVGASAKPGTVTNKAVVSGGGESDSTNNTATDPTTIAAPVPGMDLTISKRHSPNTVVPGQTFSYFITVSNVGSSSSSGLVTVTETPPPGVTVSALSGAGWTCPAATLTCTRSDALAAAASYPDLSVTASVGDDVAPGTVTNTAVVSGGGDPNPGNNTAKDPTVITSPVSGSDLTISKTHSQSIVIPGDTVTYTVTVRNVGSGPSKGLVTVTETPPTGLTITGLSGDGWICNPATGTCTRDHPLGPDASYPPITVTTSVGAGASPGIVMNTVVVSGGGDSNPTNNTATDPTIIATPAPGIDLTITKRHSPNTVVPGQTFSYFITVSNVGGSPSSGPVTVIETPPAGLTVTALSGAGWTCTVATTTCTRSDALAAASSYPDITVTTSVGASVAPGTVTNTVVVSGSGDPNLGNNTATDPTVITSPAAGPDLTLTKAQSGGVVTVGQLITFTLRVTNVGTGPTSGTIDVTEAPPPGLTITALSGAGWACVVATRTCLRNDALAPGMNYPDITVTARIEPSASGTLANRAVVSGGGDVDPGNSIGLSPITLPPLPVPVLPLSFVIGLMGALLATALWALRARTT